MPCPHSHLRYDCSPHAQAAGFSRPLAPERLAASRPSNRALLGQLQAQNDVFTRTPPSKSTFPAPLVLPGDELAYDPAYDAQSFDEWHDEEARNAVTSERRTVYLVPVPGASKTVNKAVSGWSRPLNVEESGTPKPRVEDVLGYLQAFYHGLPVKTLESPRLQFVQWEQTRKTKRAATNHIGLDIGSEAIGVRHRPSKDGIFAGQLNLNDLLDAAISMLPADAYALLMLVEHDLYEDDDDDFCCGRAYGGSRVAVVSMARYNPALDEIQEVENEHAWPASHCATYIRERCTSGKPAPRTTKKAKPDLESSAMHAALGAFAASPAPPTQEQLSLCWLVRTCKTASHELGHCFGIDHCVYYACIMQGTAGLAEDVRQPPYLCPVDLNKVLTATGSSPRAHYQALLRTAEKFATLDPTFAAFAGWLRSRLEEL